MSCDGAHRLESEAIDRLLSEEQEEEFHRHLATCNGCRSRYRQLARLQATLAQVGRVPTPPELDNTVRAIWHPTLRPLPTLRLYPYVKGYLAWDLRKLRFMGHL